jgi:serine/threonine-protein kinase
MSAHVATALGWTLGPYRIAREIGRGQFGTVYEAADAHGQPIALKLVPVDGPDAEEKLSAERQGAELQQRFSRAADQLVPKVLGHERIDPYYAIAMELVGGQPLTALIRAGRIRDDRAATIAASLCRFLIAAHEFSTGTDSGSRTVLVHGDLKPAHVLLLPDGGIRVLDFGIAKALAASKTATTNLWSSVDYASPERLESGRVNEHADFWSLGVMLFEMVSGVRPYSAYEHSRSRLETAIRTQQPRLRVPADVDARLTAIVDKLLAPQVENRYHTARQIAADLQAYLDGTPVVAFIEASRADQATVRVAPPVRGERSDWNRPTEPLPPRTAVQSATVRPAPVAVMAVAPPPIQVAQAESSQIENAPVAAAPDQPAAPPTGTPIAPIPAPVPAAPSVAAPASSRSLKPWIAAALSFLVPGFGQIYNREYLRGIFWLVITPGFWVGTGGALGWPFHLAAAYTAYRRARLRHDPSGGQEMKRADRPAS